MTNAEFYVNIPLLSGNFKSRRVTLAKQCLKHTELPASKVESVLASHLMQGFSQVNARFYCMSNIEPTTEVHAVIV